jgi:hypothetical protein
LRHRRGAGLSGGKRKTERGDARGGGLCLLPLCVLNSEAFRTASPRAIKVLLAICAKHNGSNNGRIGLGFRGLADWCDCQNHAANNQALGELVSRGLLAVECEHPRAQRLSTEYRLTFVATDGTPATNDYRHWQIGDAGTVQKRSVGNFGVAATETGKPASVAITATGGETSRCDYHNGVHAKAPLLSADPVVMAATHIGKPFGGVSASPEEPLQLSAAPDPDELRGRVTVALEAAGRGAQGQLAAYAQIRPAALSKFLRDSGSLNDAARIRLTMALPKIRGPGRKAASGQ